MPLTRSQRLKEESELENARQESVKSQKLILKLHRSKPIQHTSIRRSTRLQAASTPNIQRTISGRVTKPKKASTLSLSIKTEQVVQKTTETVILETETVVQRRIKRSTRSLKVKLSNIRYSKLSKAVQHSDYKILRQQKRLENFKGRYFPPPLQRYENRYQFLFGHNPFHHLNFQGPSAEQQWHVYNLMKKDLKDNFNKECFLDQPDASTNELQSGPMHMSDELTVDNLVKVILSISTENRLAIKQHAQLCSKFTYTVGGKEVKGTIPNYHKMRVCSPEELIQALNIAGYQNMRQKAFHCILKEIFRQNLRRMRRWDIMPEGNRTDACDFVPGLLSMEYLKGDGLTKQERFDMLVKFDQIAVKTGCCLLAFNLKIPVFVVDTHVHNMTRNLGWIPEDCFDADKACMFLDKNMPDELKFGLHQAFWHHRINCVRCMPRANPKSLAYQQRLCPLENLMKRGLAPLRQVSMRVGKDKTLQQSRKLVVKEQAEKRKPGSVTFLNIHSKVARERGYVLRKVEIDDNFGDGSRQNKDHAFSYYWGRKELAHDNDIVKLEDALVDMRMSPADYEARFAKKPRSKKVDMVKLTTLEMTQGNERQEVDVDTADGKEDDDTDIASDVGQAKLNRDTEMTNAP